MTPLSGYLLGAAIFAATLGAPLWAACALFALSVGAQALPVLSVYKLRLVPRGATPVAPGREADAPPADYDTAVAALEDTPAPDHRPLDDGQEVMTLQTDPDGPTGDLAMPEDTRIAAL